MKVQWKVCPKCGYLHPGGCPALDRVVVTTMNNPLLRFDSQQYYKCRSKLGREPTAEDCCCPKCGSLFLSQENE